MATAFDIYGVIGRTGYNHVAALILPLSAAGVQLVTAGGTNMTGGTATATTSIGAGNTKIILGLTESPAGSGQFEGTGSVGGSTLPDTQGRPYTVEVREVPVATTMTGYSNMLSAFNASTTVRYARGVPDTLGSGHLVAGEWVTPSDIRFVEGDPATPVSNAPGDGVRSIKIETRETSTTAR